MKQIELKRGIEVHDLYFNGDFIDEINEEELDRLRADIAVAYENESEVTKSGYYLREDIVEISDALSADSLQNCQIEYHIMTDGMFDKHPNKWWNNMAKSLSTIVKVKHKRKANETTT